ncbi:AAA family ATPase [Planctomicrobium sp. SH527]|uniref:AAA family ATPase n=1 Tax=Planctomicrobium sp. SH527 TaxID=3448123 RepID=UPI003F5B2BA3
MYEEFFGLNRRPYSAVPCAEDFVAGAPLQDALDSVIHCVSQARGIAVVTSQPGMGKTMLCKRMVSLLRDRFSSIYLNGAGIETRRALLQAILFELGGEYIGLTEQEARLQLFQLAKSAIGKNGTELQGILLIIDEAHLLRPRLFEELKTLADYAPDGQALIRVVLCGPFELEEKLTDPGLMGFNQRIGVQISLAPLTLEESAALIGERLRACGAVDISSILTEPALELICRASDGNLRCLTQLADHSMLLAFAMNRRPIDEATVRAALDDLKELPLRWSEIPPPDSEDAAYSRPVVKDERRSGSTRLSRSVYTSEELETDEFPIPEFLLQPHRENVVSRDMDVVELELDSDSATYVVDDSDADFDEVDDSEMTAESISESNSDPADDSEIGERRGVESVSESISRSDSPPKPEPQFVVYEVGEETAEIEPVAVAPVAIASLVSPSVIESESSESIEFSPEIISHPFVPENPFMPHPVMANPVRPETDMDEIPVLDRYTLLDRYLELPEELQAEFDFSLFDQIPHEPEFHAFDADDADEAWEEETAGTLDESTADEVELLEAIHRLSRDVLGQLKQSGHVPLPPRPHRFDIVEPDMDSAVTIPFGTTEETVRSERPEQVQVQAKAEPVTAVEVAVEVDTQILERKFSNLFTRLRNRRRRLEAEQQENC